MNTQTRRRPRSLTQTVALLGLAMGAVTPMSGCSSQDAGAGDAASSAESSASGEQGVTNPCAVTKKKKNPCAVGG
jgi:hypothetical protein